MLDSGDGGDTKKHHILPKLIAIFAVVFAISAGLCGLNLAVSYAFNSAQHPALIVLALFESIGMVIGLGGLIVVGVSWLITKLVDIYRQR